MQVSPFANMANVPFDAHSAARVLSPPQPETLRKAMQRMIEVYGGEDDRAYKRFMCEARKAWKTKFPSTKRKGPFQDFIKHHMSAVCEKYPDTSHKERMILLGKMWKDTKTT